MRVILDNCEVDDKGCWIWQRGKTHNGYGRAWYFGKEVRAHRLAYILFKGEIPEGLQIDHLCNQRDCVNTAHMQCVTPLENVMATHSMATARKERLKTHCPAGHEYNAVNTHIYKTWRNCRVCARAKVKKFRLKKLGRL